MRNVLLVGRTDWCESMKSLLEAHHFHVESIDNVPDAEKRLSHNNFGLLVIDDDFCRSKTMRFATLTFALTKPTIIKCSTLCRFLFNVAMKFNKWLFKRFNMAGKVVQYHLCDKTFIKTCRIHDVEL